MEVVLVALGGVMPALLQEVRTTAQLASAHLEEPPEVATATEVRLRAPRTPEGVRALADLRCAVAAYLAIEVDTPRPSGLTSTQALAAFDRAMEAIAWQRPRVRFTGLRLEAAGSDTDLMRRVAQEFADRAGVPVADDGEGDLMVRVRRRGPGWEALVRTTARPLATRAWRTERYPGALNATIAAAIVTELGVCEQDVVVDLMCGSGTLLIERMARGPAAELYALDRELAALAALRTHLRAARVRGRVEVVQADIADVCAETPDGAARLPYGRATWVVANPPWGELLGEHETNERLYGELLDAVDRLGAPEVVAGILTHDIRRFETLLERDERWRVVARPQFFAKGHRPRLFVLRRNWT